MSCVAEGAFLLATMSYKSQYAEDGKPIQKSNAKINFLPRRSRPDGIAYLVIRPD